LLADRAAMIEPGQVPAIVDADSIERLAVGEFLDADHDVGEMLAKRAGRRPSACAASRSIRAVSG
jgi:hypothetical protein